MDTKIKSKREVPLIGKLAVKYEFVTKAQLKRAMLICDESAKDGKVVSLPEVFVRTEMILPDKMKKLHKIRTDYEAQQNKKTATLAEYNIRVSDDGLTVGLLIPENFSGHVTVDEVKAKLEYEGIKFGLVKDYEIENYINNVNEHGKPKIIARGTPVFEGNPPKVDCLFKTQFFRNEKLNLHKNGMPEKGSLNEVEDGDLLVEKTAMIPPDSGINVYGDVIEVEPFDDIVMRVGAGTELFEKEMKIVSKTQGVPFQTVDGRVSVYPTVEISGDYGVASGPVEQASNYIVKGIVSGEYRVKGGSVSAQEIRGANIDAAGSVDVKIGITGSVIRCEGDVRAKYIRGSVIETYGSVVTEQEIMDSTIISSGICKSTQSKFVASKIAAKRGVKAAGIGTETSVPCEITIGKDVNVEKKIERIDATINKNNELIAELRDKSTGFTEEQSHVNQKLKGLMEHHRQLSQAISATDSNISLLEMKDAPEELQKTKQTLAALKKKHKSTVESIRGFSDMLKEIDSELTKIPDEVVQFEKENSELVLDKQFILRWANKNEAISLLEVSGEVAGGTIVTGVHSSREMKKTGKISVSEVFVKGSNPEEWMIEINKPGE